MPPSATDANKKVHSGSRPVRFCNQLLYSSGGHGLAHGHCGMRRRRWGIRHIGWGTMERQDPPPPTTSPLLSCYLMQKTLRQRPAQMPGLTSPQEVESMLSLLHVDPRASPDVDTHLNTPRRRKCEMPTLRNGAGIQRPMTLRF
jgi:hypothetical protein